MEKYAAIIHEDPEGGFWAEVPALPGCYSQKFDLSPDVPVSRQTPPTFLLQAENDPVDNVNNSFVHYIALKNAGVPVEMHLYAEGRHAFGLRRTKFPITRWPELMESAERPRKAA